MSRSNNQESFNPSVRWMEFNGEKGGLKYFDKDKGEKGEKVELPFNLTFIVLDQLSTIKGWNDPSESGVYSNEVKDIVKEPLLVKSFKGGLIAQGFYKDIRDKVVAIGGHFTANIYIAIKIDGKLQIAALQFKGAALNSWIEFAKKNRAELYKKAIQIVSVEDGKKGSVVFKTPVFKLTDISDATNEQAMELDKVLQEHLTKYFAKNTSVQTEIAAKGNFDGVDADPKENLNQERQTHRSGKIEPNNNPMLADNGAYEEATSDDGESLPF